MNRKGFTLIEVLLARPPYRSTGRKQEHYRVGLANI